MTYMKPARFLLAMKKTPIILQEILKGITQEQAQAARDGVDGWSVVEVMCHIRDYEVFFLARVRAMLEQENPTFPLYNQDALAKERNYQAQNLREAYTAYLSTRQEFIGLLEGLPESEWQRAGTHPETGRITIMEQAMQCSLHDVTHIEQIVHTLQDYLKAQPG